MKTLFLMRHAKSSWKYPGLSDHDRPLNGRGRHDAPLMGRELFSREVKPELIMCSTTVRALTTATLVAKELEYDPIQIQTDPQIYTGDHKKLLEVIREVSDEVDTLIFVGHNYPLSDLANLLSPEKVGEIPTAGIVALQFNVKNWKDISPDNCEFLFSDKPKNYKVKDKKKDKDKEKEKEKKDDDE